MGAFLLSLVIHASLGVPLLQDFFGHREPKLKPAKPIEVEIISGDVAAASRPTPTQPTANARPRSAQVTSPDQAKKTADIFGGGFFSQHLQHSADSDISLPASNQRGSVGDPVASVQGTGQGWSGAVQYGNAMGLKFTLESLAYFEALYDRVNSQLVYPDDFARQRFTGRVRIEAELSKDGKLIRFLSSTADDRLLQTYCFAVLMQILSQPLPRGAWLEYDRANVAFDFDFRVRIPSEAPHEYAREVQKNRLGFGRENEVIPLMNEKFNEIITRYVPPIIPIPGGFYIDIIAAYAFVNNLIEGTPTESEQRQARIEKLHESLRGTVHRQSASPTPSPTPDS